jgi:MFS family permease
VTFLIGLIGFAGASAVGGAAVNFTMLVTARACQGAFAALLAPAALSLLTTTFSKPDERGKAFGVYGAIAGAGGLVGLLLGGVLTEYLNWRWCLYVNLVFASIAVVGSLMFLTNSRSAAKAWLDFFGVVTVSGSMFCLVYGFSNAATHNWHTPSTWGFLAAGVILLVIFAWWQTRAAHPLLPPRILLDRNRGGAYLAVLIAGAGMFGIFLFLTYYLQTILGYSPVVTGLAFLPTIAMVMLFSQVANVILMPRIGPKLLVGVGMLLAAAGMMWLTQIGVHSNYASAILGPLLVTGAGIGLSLPPSMNTGTFGGGTAGRGRRLRHPQCRPAARRLHRHCPAQHDRHQRYRQLPRRPAPARRDPGLTTGSAGPGGCRRAWVHNCLLVDGRHLRGWCRCLRLPAALGSAGPANRNADRRSRRGASGRSVRPRLRGSVVGWVRSGLFGFGRPGLGAIEGAIRR